MNDSLDIQNNPNATFENDFVFIHLDTEEITWKSGMFTPKMQKNILYHLKKRNK